MAALCGVAVGRCVGVPVAVGALRLGLRECGCLAGISEEREPKSARWRERRNPFFIKREPSLRGVFDPRVADWYTQVSTSLKRGPLLLFTRVNTEVYGPRREATWHRKSRGTCNTPHTSRLTPGGHSHTVTELASGPRLRETACSPTTLPSGRRARAHRPGGSRSRNGPRAARARWVPPRTNQWRRWS